MSDSPCTVPTATGVPRVLVVDADTELLRLIEYWLQPQGVEVHLAAAAVTGELFDLVVIDMPFPCRDHVAALRAGLDARIRTPILVLSSTVFASVDCCGSAARALGADGLLPLPTTGDALRGAVRRLIAHEMEPPRSLRALPPEGALSPFGTAGRN